MGRRRKQHNYQPYNDPLLQEFVKERNLKNSTVQGYASSLQIYIPLCGFKDAKDMITEALTDEKNHIPIKESRIKKHLKKYHLHLQEMVELNKKRRAEQDVIKTMLMSHLNPSALELDGEVIHLYFDDLIHQAVFERLQAAGLKYCVMTYKEDMLLKSY